MRADVPRLSLECAGTSQSAPVTDATSDERNGVIRHSQALCDPSRLPPAAIFACFTLAGALVALDLVISSHYGLLAYPPVHDGLAYMAGAKSLYYTVAQSMHEPSILGILSHNWALLHAPLWVGLMSATYIVFGEGEWQSHVVRIWPIFLLLLLIFWFVRRRWHSGGAWFAVGVTAMLPTAVPALAACARGSAREAAFETYLLGDPRPDLLAAVLLAWAVVLLIENVDSPRETYSVYSGVALGLACLTKPSGMPAFIMVWGLVWVYSVAVNRRNLRRAAAGYTLSLSLAAVIIIPYLWLGGYQHVRQYVWDAIVTHSAVWSVSSSWLAELAYYWVRFDHHLGIGGWLLFVTGLATVVVALYRGDSIDRATLSYLVIAVGFFLLVATTKSKNAFLGLPFYLFLCLFSWAAIAAARQRSLSKTSQVLCVVALSLGTLTIAARAGSFLVRNRHEPPTVIGQNKAVLRQIALDLRAHLKPGEVFTTGDWFTYTAGDVPYYAIDDKGRFLYPEVWDPYQGPDRIDEYINDRVAKTKVALLWKEDVAQVSKSVIVSLPQAYEYYRAVHRWINRPGSPYVLVKEYTLYFPSHQTLTLQLYARAP
jgi:hypothetical protein